MEASVGVGLVGVVAAAVAGCFAGRALYERQVHHARTRMLLGQAAAERQGPLRWYVRNGCGPLKPLAEALLRVDGIRKHVLRAQQSLEERGYQTTQVALLSLVILAMLGCVGGGMVVTSSPVFGFAVAGGAVVVGCSKAKSDAERRASAMRDEIPDALRSLGVCFKAGLSLMQTLRQTGTEMKGPLGDLFLTASRTLETGGTAAEALALFGRRSDTSELAFVAVALSVQHQAGGSLAHVLDAARESVEGEIELARSLRVQTAQAKLSARIVTIMPFVLVALFSLMSPGFLTPFFSSVPGVMLLGAALVMQAAGVLLVHRMLDVGVG